MRLRIVESGHRAGARALLTKLESALALAHAPDVSRTLLYRPELFGLRYTEYLNQAARGPSPWSVGERELMAAFVSKLNSVPGE